jgi:hypothetical protein
VSACGMIQHVCSMLLKDCHAYVLCMLMLHSIMSGILCRSRVMSCVCMSLLFVIAVSRK